uniref:RWD domain-containing protein 3-like n=1 Tax=Crassostrea virginica TaxID=6565 RepID=A0A8B8CLJ4_CRAVI|nr:RWD domain-containing protein 3-like [Crassostrea virginica]
MRSKARYTQTIQKWAGSLSLKGSLLFVGKLIFIVLQGHSSNIKEYIKLQRSSNVDVDSRGKKCKERMMSILHQGSHKERGEIRVILDSRFEEEGFTDFSVIECSSQPQVEDIFQRAELLPLYQEHILPVLTSSK